MSTKRCDSGHSNGTSTACRHCNNLGLVNGEILVSYDPVAGTPEVRKHTCKYCGVINNQITPHNLTITQAQWNTYMAM